MPKIKKPKKKSLKKFPKTYSKKIEEVENDLFTLALKFNKMFPDESKFTDENDAREKEGIFVILVKRIDTKIGAQVYSPISFGRQVTIEDIVTGVKDAILNIFTPNDIIGEA